MAQSLSLNQQGSLPKKAVTITPGMKGLTFGAQPKPTSNFNSQTQPLATPQVGPSTIGTNPGIIKTPQPSTPVKSQTTPDGITTTYHAPAKETTGATKTATTSNPTPTPTGSTTGMINTPKPTTYTPPDLGVNGVSQGGIIGNVMNAGQTTPDERYFQKQYVDSVKGKQFGQLAPYAEASMYAGKTPEELQGLITAPDLAGRSSADTGLYNTLGNAYGTAAQAGLSAAQTSAARNLTANTSAGQLNAPIQQGYSSMLVNPATGQPYNQSGGTLQDAVSNVVQKLTAGQMSYNDALTALSGYGQGGVNALQQALPPGFNIAQSNTLAGQQGSIGVNYQLADTALKNVENILSSLGAAQTTNIPLINRGANWLSTQFGVGSEQTRAMTGAVQSLRNAYASLLASSKGGTPTDYSGQAMAEIPNEPTPNDIAAIRKNFETLGQARKDILSNPGQASGNTPTTGGKIITTPSGLNINPNF